MWSSFTSKDPFKSFPYEIGERLNYSNSSIWEVHNGTKLATKEPVTLFIHEIKPEASHLLEIVRNTIKCVKRLRHPNLLKYFDSIENDKFIYLITDRVTPLEIYLHSYPENEENKKRVAITWGLHQICTGLIFLINECNLAHNNVCAASVFVDNSGEWYLGGLEYVTSPKDKPPSKVLSSLDKYVPPNFSKTNKWASDSWGLGCLIWEIFNGPLPKASSLQSHGKIPEILKARYFELVNPNSRPSLIEFLNQCKTDYMKNKFVDSMLFIEQIQIKDQNELSRFYSSLPNYLDDFPKETCKVKILQQIINSFEYGNAGSHILASLLKIGKLLDEKEFQTKIVPIVIKLFSSKDRATRAKLMQQIDQYIHHIPPALVNEQIFHHIVSGFTDSNPQIREQTIKSIIHLAPKLNQQNLNEEVIKHFARIQIKDDQGGIRTNTTVCLGKIAGYLNPDTRQKILIYAFARALKDPFPPARTAGILAFSATQAYFSLQECATKVLPALCLATIDPEKSIREHAFKAIRGFLDKLEKGYESPTSLLKVEVAPVTSQQPSSAVGWAEWAMTSFTSKFLRPTIKSDKNDKESLQPLPQNQENMPSSHQQTNEDSGHSDYEDTVADADWTPIEEVSKGDEKYDSWEDSNWGTFENLEGPQQELILPSGKEMITKSSEIHKSKSCDVSLLAKDPSIKIDSSDEWGIENWDFDSVPSQNDQKKAQEKKRLEKREQRNREMELKRQARQKQGGPLKLGARKVS